MSYSSFRISTLCFILTIRYFQLLAYLNLRNNKRITKIKPNARPKLIIFPKWSINSTEKNLYSP